MTCIVGFIDKNNDVYIGGDSAGVAGLNVHERKDSKVFTVGKFLIGYTSSFRMGQILRFKLNVPEQTSQQNDYEFMCTTFIDSVRTCLKDNGYSTIKNNEESIGTFLVGYNSKLYVVENDLQVGEHYDDYNSVGCGSSYAFGALNILKQSPFNSPKFIIEEALKTASKFSGGVRPPFVIKKL